ncbi:hypothetical protein CBR_g36707 [Chara braunii]|uniref:Uncharacterized protein n=1 Tax=Chara braunii TaxID=69332 RepID=A0A388LL93_CHABU|nr:hypothetical protein CBR_g36707 [Chara braunii]|eukprot:GBG83089.1 hypothetical protein CBR_g36707 [Chara braunii]
MCFALLVEQVPSFSSNEWYSDLLVEGMEWLDMFPAPARPTQALISLAPPRILEFVRLHSVDVSPPLITILSFDLWSDLLWTASNDKPTFLKLTKFLVTQSREIVEEDDHVSATVDVNIAMKEKFFVDLFGAESNFHAGLVQTNLSIEGVDGEDEGDEEEDKDALPLTEEEKAYHAKILAEGRKEKLRVVADNQRSTVNNYVRNAFLPITPPRWIEAQSRSVGDKLWELYTFNYLAPIHADSYRFLASLTEEEMKKCGEKALTENTDLIKGNYPLTPSMMKLPVVGDFDHTKCCVSASALAVRGFLAPKQQSAMAELKRIWNVGRPYLKCLCVAEGKGDCGRNISWFDHVLWYLLSDLHYLFPEAPSLKARTRAFRVRARSTWRAAMLASVVFTHMRDIMVKMAYNVVVDPSRTTQNILDDPAIMLHKFPWTMAKLILPARYVRSSEKRRKEDASASLAKKTRKSQPSILEFYVPPARDSSAAPTKDASDLVDLGTPASSSITVQEDGQTSACSRPLRRSHEVWDSPGHLSSNPNHCSDVRVVNCAG